jgi:hypothetical protein
MKPAGVTTYDRSRDLDKGTKLKLLRNVQQARELMDLDGKRSNHAQKYVKALIRLNGFLAQEKARSLATTLESGAASG